MDIREYTKLEIASRQLEMALTIFNSGGGPFSALTLAGAAEEVFGKFVKKNGEPAAIDHLADSYIHLKAVHSGEVPSKSEACSRINSAKNSVKHMNLVGDEYVYLDPKWEAHEMIMRCIVNFKLLEQPLTNAMIEFLNKDSQWQRA